MILQKDKIEVSTRQLFRFFEIFEAFHDITLMLFFYLNE